jgi:hypothetical protein
MSSNILSSVPTQLFINNQVRPLEPVNLESDWELSMQHTNVKMKRSM